MTERLMIFAPMAALVWLLDERTRSMGLPGPVERNGKYQALVRGRREYQIGRGLLFSVPLALLLVAPGQGRSSLGIVAITYMALCLTSYAALFFWSAEKCDVWKLEMRSLKKAGRRRQRNPDKT